MTDLNQLTELAELWGGGSPPRVAGARCMNVRHRARACRICVDACPADAISIPFGDRSGGDGADAAPIALNQDTCVRCGLCLNVCPTGVFVQPELPEFRLAQAITRSQSQAIELACPRKEPAAPSRVPQASVVQTPRCLAALSVPTLLGLSTVGKTLWLNDSICHACPVGHAFGVIQRAIAAANRWLQVMGRPPAIRSYLTAADELADEPVSQPVVRGDPTVITRRDFFRSLTGLAGQATASVVAEIPGGPSLSQLGDVSPSETGGHGLSHHIPAQRQHLAYALRRLAPDPAASVPTAALPIADVRITDACTACNLCVQFCPTEAITLVSDEEYYVLNFSAALCLGKDCSLCVIGCPTDAVRFGQEVTAGELLSTQPRPIKAGRLAPCDGCGAPTDVPLEADETTEAPLCYVCQAQAGHINLLGSLADRKQGPE